MANWTVSDIPHQRGRSALVTGAAGLGFEDALALARAGAEVILASRDPAKGTRAVEEIHRAVPSANVRFEALDLASLASVAAFSARLLGQRDSLDVLINNAGVMRPPQRMETADGFELQLGTNHLGHFALTAGLMPLLVKARKARVVTLSSIAARGGGIDFDDLQSTRRYRSMAAYSQSKLACLMFAFELQRRSEAGGWGVASLAAHPGLSRTELLLNAPGAEGRINPLFALFRRTMQPASQGALPTLFAATAPEARPGGYYGPDRMSETRGHPAPSRVPPQAADTAVAERLWRVSEELTGVSFPAAA
ncbi:SDR family NAD(P)-dependent oxidoreductase [Caulobacter sp. SLTY]|uniref:SDR family oxidoreductase n=1 Tax=Caulobacter sp. SLTY TaxID=2683262 RepID=UPI00141224DB|nr:SDR family oxidoreductase [Caulobacter sp. SLTY]NBB16515.1 SDR family NAD(P)-dependent oxidoreductase [Caulobacter sp. SLTY]